MKNLKFLFLTVFVFTLHSCKKEFNFDDTLVRQTSIQSKFTGSQYPIYIVLPKNYSVNKKYETLYVLDGDDELDGQLVYKQIGLMCQNSSSKYSKENVIIVAISSLGQDERFRDLAPVPSVVQPIGQGGGSENYAKFLELEVKPYIEKNFSVDTTSKGRVICGHSLGGTMTGYMFTKHPDVFSNYLTLSPAFWWGDGVMLKYEEEARAKNSSNELITFVGYGEFEEGIRIYAEEWIYRLKSYYPNCQLETNLVKKKGHISSAKENISKSIDFYYSKK